MMKRALRALARDVQRSSTYQRLVDLTRFSESFYLRYYRDVRCAVESKTMRSGLVHYMRHGLSEGRSTHPDPHRLLYRKIGAGIEPTGIQRLDMLEGKLEPVPCRIDDSRIPTANVFIPTLDPSIFFGGYVAFLQFLTRLAEAGVRLRFIVLEDRQVYFDWFLEEIADRPRWVEAFRSAEFVNATDLKRPVGLHFDDANIAYSTWSVLKASAAAALTRFGRLAFFIQDYEPAFYAHDSTRLLSHMAYNCPHVPIFNSRALHDYFKKYRISAFCDMKQDQIFFEPAITTKRRSSPRSFARRLLFYARPEAHAGRNLFEIGILALRKALRLGIINRNWELVGIGSLIRSYDVAISDSLFMRILPRIPQAEYETFLAGFDVGLSLISTPHPGMVHFEWATAGIPTVVNQTPERDSEFFRRFGLPLLPAEASIDGILSALALAIDMARQGEPAQSSSDAAFAVSWDAVFDAAFMQTVLDRCAIPVQRQVPLKLGVGGG